MDDCKSGTMSETNASLLPRLDNVLFKDVSEIVYTHCYCEENVWHMCNSVMEKYEDSLHNCFCVFISNHDRMIPLWCQKASKNEDGVVVWDYHVIFIHKGNEQFMVYDPDSSLKFPCTFQQYLTQGIKPCQFLKPQFHRYFRVIKAGEFLHTFASDRSHMLDKEGKWLKPPPTYPCIHTQESSNNLQDFISMKPDVGVGNILDFNGLCKMFMTEDAT